VLKSKIDAPALKSHVPSSNNRRLKLGDKGGERVGESQLEESWESRNECAKLWQQLEIRWVAYILGLRWATRSSGGSHRNFRSNEIRSLGLSVNLGPPELSVPGPELLVHIRTSRRNPEQFSCTRTRTQTAPTGTSGAWPELSVTTGTSGQRPEQNTRTRTCAGASDRNFRCSSPELPVQLTRTSSPAHQNFRSSSPAY
jgi:hypothetical protein